MRWVLGSLFLVSLAVWLPLVLWREPEAEVHLEKDCDLCADFDGERPK